MRKIPLKTIEVGKVAGQDAPPLDFAQALKDITSLKQDGFRAEELRKILRIHDAIDLGAKKMFVLLEEEDWNYLKARVDTHVFPFACRAFAQLADAVDNAETIEVAEVKKAR